MLHKKLSTLATWTLCLTVLASSCKDKSDGDSDNLNEQSSEVIGTKPIIEEVDTPPKPSQTDLEDEKFLRAVSQEILWGKSIGGIDLNMTEKEINETLSGKVSSTESYDVYREGIYISWNEESPRKPAAIFAGIGYQGVLKLPAPYESVQIGQSLAEFFTDETSLDQFLGGIGAFAENKKDEYNCREALTCRFARFNATNLFEFKKGGIALDSNLRVAYIYIAPDQDIFFPRITEPSIFGKSIAGFNLESTRTDVEAKIGPPQGNDINSSLLYYDDFNLITAWTPDANPAFLIIREGHIGEINFGTPIIAEKQIFRFNESLVGATYNETDIPTELNLQEESVNYRYELMINFIHHQIKQRDAGADAIITVENCLLPTTDEMGNSIDPSCKLRILDEIISFDFQRGSIGVSKDEELLLKVITLTPERSFPISEEP